jgi:phosphinothricin acetyltransferase
VNPRPAREHAAYHRRIEPDPTQHALALRAMTPADWTAVRAIYQAGIETGDATFETSAPEWDRWDRAHLTEHRIVATDAMGVVIGWVALSPVSDRCAYAGVAEHSVYVRPDRHRRGVGRALLEALIESAEHAGIWTIQTGIFPENVPSIELHQAMGFRVIGRRERIGKLHDRWRDTLLLERRSARIGTD